MLKNPAKAYQDTFIDSPNAKQLPMSDEQVERYIHVFFSNSPRANSGTAPTFEWLQFLEIFNEQQNHYILTEQQKKAIKPYCIQNPDLEMTPEEFVRLLAIIRHEATVEERKPRATSSTPATKRLFDSRPRSSRLISSKSATTYYDDRASTNHPDDNLNHMSDRTRESDFNDENNNNDHDISLVKRLRKEKSVAARQAREYESRIEHLNKEHSERIMQVQTRLENMQIEAEQQKQLLADQKLKEKDKIEKIVELKSQNAEYEKLHALAVKKLQKKTEELELLKEELHSLQEAHNMTLSQLELTEIQAKEMLRVHEKEKADFHMKLDQEKRQTLDARHALEAQQNENVKLMELIDKQKFDLDEARSGLRYYSNSSPPSLDKKTSAATATSSPDINETEHSFAHEKIEAKYLKKIELIQQERDEFEQQLVTVRDKLKEEQTAAALIQEAQTKKIQDLSTGFDQQLGLIDSIRQSINTNQPGQANKLYVGLTVIPWVFLFYHLLLIMFYYAIELTQSQAPQVYPLSLSRFLDEMFFKYMQSNS
ncbi:transcriptional repressor [Mucor velutinosus]|uniref:Transcriptional repressor n=1 Tax=Mucor velutinosus TaxID=708070 RepID=A0AAN7I053_9FUNG|nr:transcriptional repressor [Mucor velutinosus]